MNLSSETLMIFKNFADINDNLTIFAGNQQKTIDAGCTIRSEATTQEVFPVNFGIYDLREFLAVLGMYKMPVLEFNEQYCDIIDKEDSSIRTRYWSADTEILTKVPDIDISKFDVTTFFTLSKLNLERIQRASTTLKAPDVVIKAESNVLMATVCYLQDGSSVEKSSFTIKLDDAYSGNDFSVHLKQERLKIISGDYKVGLIDDVACHFVHTSKPIQYLIVLDK